MSKSSCHSRLSSSITTTPDLDIENFMDINAENRRQSSLSDRRINNVNYVRHVLRRFFGGSNKKTSPTTGSEDTSYEQSPTTKLSTENSPSPVLIHPSLQYDKHSKFSGKIFKRKII